jgi:ferritin-like metal-binding protein YciE
MRDSNEKLVQHFNEALAMENAAVEHIQSRINETSIDLSRQQLQYHLEQTRQQQKRLGRIITDLGGKPTSARTALPKVVPVTADTVSNTIKKRSSRQTICSCRKKGRKRVPGSTSAGI